MKTCHGSLFVRVAGPATELPTLVLEAGGGASSDWWAWVQERLAKNTRVMSYDRAGLGNSTACVADFGAQAVAQRLRDLLEASHLPPPYLLVGHSLGALYARGFAAIRSADVCGLVMVDPTASKIENYKGLSAAAIHFLAALLRGFAGLARMGLLRYWHPFSGVLRSLPPHARASARAFIADPRHLAASASEIGTIRRIQAEMAAQPLSRALPMLIISAGIRRRVRGSSAGPSAHHLDLTHATDHARLLTIADADHASLLTDPSHAAHLADQILSFARECAVGRNHSAS